MRDGEVRQSCLSKELLCGAIQVKQWNWSFLASLTNTIVFPLPFQVCFLVHTFISLFSVQNAVELTEHPNYLQGIGPIRVASKMVFLEHMQHAFSERKGSFIKIGNGKNRHSQCFS